MFRSDFGAINSEKQSDDFRRICQEVSDDKRRIGDNPVEKSLAQYHNLKKNNENNITHAFVTLEILMINFVTNVSNVVTMRTIMQELSLNVDVNSNDLILVNQKRYALSCWCKRTIT